MFSLFLWAALLHYCIAFNIDTKVPVVRQGDQTGSYFGFTVAQHQATDIRTNTIKSWLLVGAPKANVSKLLAENIVSPGAVYKCDLSQTGCEQIEFDTSGNAKDSDGNPIEEKSNQWFGVSLYSSGRDGKVFSCAHRYLYYGKRRKYHMYPGGCKSTYGMMSSARYISTYDKCKKINDVHASGTLDNPDIASYYWFLYCQMGLSTIYIPERKATIFGAPGSFNFQGALFYQQSKPQYSNQIQNKSAPFGYQGYSTSMGTFFKKNQVDIVTGAPRYNHHGMVVVFEDTESLGSTPTFIPKRVLLASEAEARPQPGAGFGFSVAGVDVNNDSWTDVVVGAPFFSTKNSPNEGRVYVFMNNGDGTFTKKWVLAPSVNSRKGARFGHAVANVGDFDQDGYDDFAVGAPYEGGSGAVYLFSGSASGVDKTPAQIIKPSDIKQNFKTFGYSVAGRLDMDLNGYPDLLIGSYTSDSVVLLRSRPIIDMVTKITITPNPFNSRNKTCIGELNGKKFKTVCIDMEICLSYTERRNRTHDPLSIDLRIEADVEFTKNSRTPKESRVVFKRTQGAEVNKTLTNSLPHVPAKVCFQEKVFLREKIEDVYHNITFRINYKLREPSVVPTAAPGSLPSLKDYAMLEERKQTFASAMLQFKLDCVKCEPNLRLSERSDKTLAVGEKDFIVDATISNTGESAYSTEFLVTVPEGVSERRVLDATDSNKEPFSIRHDIITERTEDNSTRLRIPLGNPMKTSVTRRIKVFLDTASFSKSQDFLPIDLEVTSSNKEKPELRKDNLIHLNITIVSRADLELAGSKKQEQVTYGGEIKGESAMRREDELGKEVIHTYIAQNKGPDLVPEAEIKIEWPFEAKNGKHLLYLMGVEISGNAECFFEPGQINLLGLQVLPKSAASRNLTSRSVEADGSRRVRRDAAKPSSATSTKTKRATKGKGRDPVILDCKINTARCTTIRCMIKRFVKGDEVSFNVRSRIWSATLIEDYYNTDKSDEVEIISRASLHPAVTFVQEVNLKNNEAEVKTLFNAEAPPRKSEKLASWVIPVAVVGAVLALVIVVLILWKLGFFKRKKFDGNITEAEVEAILAAENKEKNANAET